MADKNENKGGDNLLLIVALLAVGVSLIAAGITYFSVANLISQISGLATSTGVANLSVETVADINFTLALITWGSGKVNSGASAANLVSMDISGNVTGGNWSLQSRGGLNLTNIGNVNTTLNITVGKNASVFMGGTSPSYMINVSQAAPNACLNATGTGTAGMSFNLGTFYNANTSNKIMNCDVFQFKNGNDAVRIDINITLPSDSLVGVLTDTITVTATAI